MHFSTRYLSNQNDRQVAHMIAALFGADLLTQVRITRSTGESDEFKKRIVGRYLSEEAPGFEEKARSAIAHRLVTMTLSYILEAIDSANGETS